MKDIFHLLYSALVNGQPVTLATVVSRKGSLPMSERAKMLVFQDGSIAGTVGGGVLEARVIQEARLIHGENSPRLIHEELTETQIDAEGLTCGGTVEILLEPFSSNADLGVIRERERLHATGMSGVAVTALPPASSWRMLLREDGSHVGTCGHAGLDQQVVDLAQAKLGSSFLGTTRLDLSDEEAQSAGCASHASLRLYLETIFPTPTAYLFGGGHVSLALAKMLAFIGVDYVVIDDRQEFLTRERFPQASAFICRSFDGACDALDLTAHSSYVIILTRGHLYDRVVLEQALRFQVKYIGMIGSKRKVKLMFDALKAQGIAPERLARVHAPIGLGIGADTPEEIAISIAAELIAVRRGCVSGVSTLALTHRPASPDANASVGLPDIDGV